MCSNLAVDMFFGFLFAFLIERQLRKPPERVKMPSDTAKSGTAWLCRVILESSPVDAAGIGSL